jgi:hypothetical protein
MSSWPRSSWKVNGFLISSPEIRAEAAIIRREVESRGPEFSLEDRLELPGLALERLIDRALLRYEAQRLGLVPSEAETRKSLAELAPRADGVSGCRAGVASPENLEEARWRLAVDKLTASCLVAVKHPRVREVSDFYRKNRDRFRTRELAHVRHLVKNFKELPPNASQIGEAPIIAAVEHMRDRLVRGDEFAIVAREESDCPEHGGDLGYIERGTMVEEFDAVVFTTPVGELSPVFRTRFGYHTAAVVDRKPDGIRALDEVAPEIRRILLRHAHDEACGALLACLRKNASIEKVTG